jgi:hypothetical protein
VLCPMAVGLGGAERYLQYGDIKVFAHGPCGLTVFNQPQSTVNEISKRSDWVMSTDPVRILMAHGRENAWEGRDRFCRAG